MASRGLGAVLVGALLALTAVSGPRPAKAQSGGVVAASPSRTPGFYEAPGFYGTSFGVPSFGSVRTYSEFSSPFGVGYGYGYAPARILPGPYGMGIWRPRTANPIEAYGASAHSYRTFAVPFTPGGTAFAPPIGVYAPAYGPKPPYPPSAYFGR